MSCWVKHLEELFQTDIKLLILLLFKYKQHVKAIVVTNVEQIYLDLMCICDIKMSDYA